MRLSAVSLAITAVAMLPGSASAVFFQPDSATASSEFNGSYDIGNAIDGSGLPTGFGPGDAHADYIQNNHWTTQSNQVPTNSFATFFFDNDVTIGTFYLWNHRSNRIASNEFYEVTDFDLVLRDGGGGILLELRGLSADGETAVAQTYAFVPVDGVRSVDFVINSNQGFEQQIGSNFTGVAEVAFSAAGVPEPATAMLAVVGAGDLLRRRQRRA